jgi:hypothetical protein
MNSYGEWDFIYSQDSERYKQGLSTFQISLADYYSPRRPNSAFIPSYEKKKIVLDPSVLAEPPEAPEEAVHGRAPSEPDSKLPPKATPLFNVGDPSHKAWDSWD